MDGGVWQATVHGVAKSQTQLSDFTFTFYGFSKLFFNLTLSRKIKSDIVSTVSPSISHELMGPHAMIFVLNVEL